MPLDLGDGGVPGDGAVNAAARDQRELPNSL